MKLVQHSENWYNSAHPKVWSCVRMALGLFLVFKAGFFLNHIGSFSNSLANLGTFHIPDLIVLGVIYAVVAIHFIGGAMITFGSYTRFWSFVQIPVLLGAVFLINLPQGHITSELLFSVATLLLLTTFMVLGSGPLSIDAMLGHTDKELMAEV